MNDKHELKLDPLATLVVVSFLAQGVSQHFCLPAQPLNHYLKSQLGYDAAQVANVQAALMWPWIIKPVFGIICDMTRARSRFLVMATLAAAAGYVTCSISGLALLPLMLGLLVAASGMAAVTVIIVSLCAEKDETESRKLFGLQSVAYYATNLLSLYLGGLLVQKLSAEDALAWALILAAVPPFLVSLYLVSRRPTIDTEKVSGVTIADWWLELKAQLARKAFFSTLLFMVFWNFSPSLGVGLYFFESDVLGFEQSFIGILGAISSVGYLTGSILFRLFARRTEGSATLPVMILVSCLVSLSYLLMRDHISAILIEFIRGTTTAYFTLILYSLAADVTPRRLSASIMATFVCLYNLAGEAGILAGGHIYRHFVHDSLSPLVLVSVIATLSTGLFIKGVRTDKI